MNSLLYICVLHLWGLRMYEIKMCFPINTSRSVGDLQPMCLRLPPWLLSFLKARWRLCHSSALPATVEDTREWGEDAHSPITLVTTAPTLGNLGEEDSIWWQQGGPGRPEGYSYRRWRGWWSRCRRSFQKMTWPPYAMMLYHSIPVFACQDLRSLKAGSAGRWTPSSHDSQLLGCVSCLATIQFAQNKCIRQPILFKTLHSITQIHELIILVKIR